MTRDDRPHATIHIPAADKSGGRETSAPVPPLAPMRTQNELAPIARKVAADNGLMQKFQEVLGSEDRERASSLIDEITQCAQSIDPTVSAAEGVRIVVVLMGMVEHPKGGANG